MCTAAAQAYGIELNITCLHTKWEDTGVYTISTILVCVCFFPLPLSLSSPLPPCLLFLCPLISLHTCCLWHTCFPQEKRLKLEWRAKAWCGRWWGGDNWACFTADLPVAVVGDQKMRHIHPQGNTGTGSSQKRGVGIKVDMIALGILLNS